MADQTAVPTIMSIVESQGGSGDPKTVVEALELLAEVIGNVDPEDIQAAVDAYLDEHPFGGDVLDEDDIDALFE